MGTASGSSPQFSFGSWKAKGSCFSAARRRSSAPSQVIHSTQYNPDVIHMQGVKKFPPPIAFQRKLPDQRDFPG